MCIQLRSMLMLLTHYLFCFIKWYALTLIDVFCNIIFVYMSYSITSQHKTAFARWKPKWEKFQFKGSDTDAYDVSTGWLHQLHRGELCWQLPYYYLINIYCGPLICLASTAKYVKYTGGGTTDARYTWTVRISVT